MGMSTHIQAFIPDTDETYQKQKKVLIACNEAGVNLPEETANYFGEKCAELYLLDEKLTVRLEKGVHYEIYRDEAREGFEIDIKKLPAGVTKVRFYNSF